MAWRRIGTHSVTCYYSLYYFTAQQMNLESKLGMEYAGK